MNVVLTRRSGGRHLPRWIPLKPCLPPALYATARPGGVLSQCRACRTVLPVAADGDAEQTASPVASRCGPPGARPVRFAAGL